MFVPLAECQAIITPPAAHIVTSVSHHLAGDLIEGIRYGDLVLRYAERPAEAGPVSEEPDPMLPIDVQMIGDNKGAGGQWYQTFALTIRPMGTLADISTIVYGDESHVNEVFAVAQKQYPELSSPGHVQVGQTIELTVDASRTHVLQKVIPGGAPDAETRVYFNGVKETIVGKGPTSVQRMVEFPADAPVSGFTLKVGDSELNTPVGTKYVELVYGEGDSFEETVKTAYGLLSSRAILDFERQTNWAFDAWPPGAGDAAAAIISTVQSYTDEPFQVLEIRLTDAEANAKYQELLGERANLGIYPIKQRPDGIIYRVTVLNSGITAKQVSQVLYNTDARFLELAELAGVQLETTDPSQVEPEFDVPLIGRTFDVLVNYADEGFVLSDQQGTGELSQKVTLLNGTVMEKFKAAETGEDGLWRLSYFPNGYRSIEYKPSEALYAVFDFLYFTIRLGQVDDQADHDHFVASMIWNWQRDIPKEPGDTTDQLTLRSEGKYKVMEALVWHREDINFFEKLLFQWWSLNPIAMLAILVFGASALFMVVVIIVRKVTGGRPEY